MALLPPKYKDVGDVHAYASIYVATARLADYNILWKTGLTFRNSSATTAVCFWSKSKSYLTDGLHLSPNLARALGESLADQALLSGLAVEVEDASGAFQVSWVKTAGPDAALNQSVEIRNHTGGFEQLWERFSDADSSAIAYRLGLAATGH